MFSPTGVKCCFTQCLGGHEAASGHGVVVLASIENVITDIISTATDLQIYTKP